MNIFEQWGWNWSSWQKGERGEYWFLAQAASIVAFGLFPIYPIVEPTILTPSIRIGLIGLSGILGAITLVLCGKGLFDLGKSLTPLPYPREDGTLVTTGAYAIVRHPLYAGLVLGTLGWAVFTLSWPHFFGCLVIVFLLNHKANLEETWLAQKYPDYSAYRSRVKKLIPWLW